MKNKLLKILSFVLVFSLAFIALCACTEDKASAEKPYEPNEVELSLVGTYKHQSNGVALYYFNNDGTIEGEEIIHHTVIERGTFRQTGEATHETKGHYYIITVELPEPWLIHNYAYFDDDLGILYHIYDSGEICLNFNDPNFINRKYYPYA